MTFYSKSTIVIIPYTAHILYWRCFNTGSHKEPDRPVFAQYALGQNPEMKKQLLW